MIDTKLDFSGLLDISKELEVLSKAESRNVLRQATRAAATVFRDEARELAPEDTGKLKRNIVVINQRASDGGAVAGVHVRSAGKAENRNNSFYWRFVELGTSQMPAVPFIRPAFDARQDDAAAAAFAKANEAIDKVLSK
ncbi:HK97-gp10 family putative phage morphogenesis protein [Serratia sp. Ag1]|uniref:HK97-gp10 family putative phage morphogenesis protein n=1 Tax=Serratia sp. Ag1 TaxID=1524467 RepID=UPI0005016BD3|nr:HK97-gp10 family putative phage morphogenesis protein [Serratia sp. Ag1]KFK98129.1 HK97 gp10 family phage protein [Serratia sp. Ag1]